MDLQKTSSESVKISGLINAISDVVPYFITRDIKGNGKLSVKEILCKLKVPAVYGGDLAALHDSLLLSQINRLDQLYQ